jgi:hypothetical protein
LTVHGGRLSITRPQGKASRVDGGFALLSSAAPSADGIVRSSILIGLLALATSGGAASAQKPVSPDAPHLLNCAVKDTAHVGPDGALVKDAPLVPGTRALGRITSFVVDLSTAVVRLPGLGDIAWIPIEGDAVTKELILTPVSALKSATSVSIHIQRASMRFIFFESDRVMTGTCELLP